MTIARKTVMISSTARDLPEHRKEVMDACLRQGIFPLMMEHLPANDAEAISASLKMVDDADIYVGVFAHRYGYVPKGHKISITEMEYNRAMERKIPRLIFVMDKDHPIKFEDIEMGKGAKKLESFKKKVLTENIVNQFKSSADLRSHVINSLSKYLEATPITIPNKETSSIDVTSYFNALRKRYNVLALEGLTPPQKEEYLQIQLRSVFVEQSVREDTPPVELPKEIWEKLSREQEIHDEDLPSGITLEDVRKARDSYYQKPPRLVLDALADLSCQYSIILGDPGSGKSTLARYVMLSTLDPLRTGDKIQKTFEGYLPLLIELRTFAGLYAEDKCETPLEFLEHLGKTEGWGLTQTALHDYLKNDGHAVIIFDGLDEIFEPKMRETITNQIVGFTNTYPKARVIVTSRILGYRRKILSDAGFVHFTLQDLNQEQVRAFITKWYELAMSERPEEARERSERILKSFMEQASIRQLAGNPMLLTIMAIIGKHQELPRERWKLYDHAASVLIQHWDVNKHLKDERIEADFIGEDDKKELLRRLAFRMQSGDGGLAGNYIHREHLQEEFENYLRERYSKAPDQAKIIAKAMIQQFRERNFILSLYGANVFGFVHRAFLEYFCASAFTWKFEKTKELPIEQLKTEVYGKHWEDQSWHEVLRLICGMIDEKWVGLIIEYLAKEIPSPQPSEYSKLFPWNIALATQCMMEVRNITLLSKSSQHLLRAILRLFETKIAKRVSSSEFDQFCEKQIVQPVISIDGNWWHREVIIKWLARHKATVSLSMIGMSNPILGFNRAYISTFIVALCSGLDKSFDVIWDYTKLKSEHRIFAIITLANGWTHSSQTKAWLYDRIQEDDDWEVRLTALYNIYKFYKEDSATLTIVLNCAVNDNHAWIRSFAVGILSEGFSDNMQILPFLQERVIQDPDPEVRSSVIEALTEHYSEDTQTLQLLLVSAVQDGDADVRTAAVSALANHYRENAQILPLLRECAVQDDDPDVRSVAVSALADHYREDVKTLPLLRECAVKDKSPKSDAEEKRWQNYVRDTAIEAIAEHWSDHPDTLQLLRDCAENDPTPWLRKRCNELIKKIEESKDSQ